MQVTLSEAATRLKVSEKTVRRWVRSGRLQGSQKPTDRGFQWVVDIPDDLIEPPEEPSGELEALREMNKLLCQELTAKNEQIRELHILLQGLQAALPFPQGTQRPWWRFWRND
jgi:predicted DNA-binding transcriptional regulator YafY